MGKFNHLWDRRLDGDKRQARSFLRVVIIALLLLAITFIFKKDNIFRWVQANRTIKHQLEQIHQLEESNNEMERQIDNLRNNIDSLETFARETYNFAKDSEDVYILE
ncbi:MAG: septum formation initiator family protein [Bacteroidales bacterium]|nr:septum formation initiator family protein [Bacteroidales bacterium]